MKQIVAPSTKQENESNVFLACRKVCSSDTEFTPTACSRHPVVIWKAGRVKDTQYNMKQAVLVTPAALLSGHRAWHIALVC